MSVISKALKTAQREKDNRTSGGPPDSVPVLVPLRSKTEPSFSWKRALALGGAGIVVFAAIWLAMNNGRKQGREAAIPVPRFDIAVPSATPPQEASANVATVTPAGTATRATRPIPSSSTDNGERATVVIPERRVQRPASRPLRVSVTRAPVDTAQAIQTVEAVPQAREPAQNPRLRIAVDQREGDVARLFALGVAAHRAGDLRAAREAYERVLLVAPNDVDALNNLGVLLAAMGDLDRAEQLLRRAVSLSTVNAGAWNNLGTVLAQRGRTNDAIASYQQALTIDPQHQGARVSLAQQHMAIGAADKAAELLEQVISSNPALPEAHYALGQAYEVQKDWPRAIRAYSAFIRVAPPRLAADVGRVQARVEMLSRKGR